MLEDPRYSYSELEQAGRNHSMPAEAMRYDVTPVGLHYLLHHFDIPQTSAEDWTLTIAGAVSDTLTLTLDQLRTLPSQTEVVTMECAGNGRALLEPPVRSMPWITGAVGNAEWTGTPLWPLLAAAGLCEDAVEVVFTGADEGIEGEIHAPYRRSLTMDEVQRSEVMLVYAMNGQPLPPQHGAPLRLLVPGWYGMASVKWLRAIDAVTEPFQGYIQVGAYIIREDEDGPGRPATSIVPRALMIPPGIPDADTRERSAALGTHRIVGRAWCGTAEIARVEFSPDGGVTWTDAELESASNRFGWQRREADWTVEERGTHVLACRATDATGQTQPEESLWNVGGYENNGIEKVTVEVG